jgi:hypothetical protein
LWTLISELVPRVSLILPVTIQFSNAMEFLPSMTSASELLAVKVEFRTVIIAVEFPVVDAYGNWLYGSERAVGFHKRDPTATLFQTDDY